MSATLTDTRGVSSCLISSRFIDDTRIRRTRFTEKRKRLHVNYHFSSWKQNKMCLLRRRLHAEHTVQSRAFSRWIFREYNTFSRALSFIVHVGNHSCRSSRWRATRTGSNGVIETKKSFRGPTLCTKLNRKKKKSVIKQKKNVPNERFVWQRVQILNDVTVTKIGVHVSNSSKSV